MNQQNLSSFIWSVEDLLRGDYKQSEYVLPFTVLRRLDCVLEPTKEAVLQEFEKPTAAKVNPEPFLLKKSGNLFYNTLPLDIKKLMGDQDNIGENMYSYIQAFSPAVRDFFECFDSHTQVERLAKANLLYLVTEKFANIDLHPEVVSNEQMGFGEAKEAYVDPETGKPVKLNKDRSPRPVSVRGAGGEGQRIPVPTSRIFMNTDFGYQTITVERPELDADVQPVLETKGKRKGQPKPDSKLQDNEEVPLGEDVDEYFQREVIPHVPDARIDHDKTKIGYEIPFNRHFYVFKPPRELDEIDAELKGVTDRIVKMIGELS